MPISALPESTARAIGSILVLNDACAVVKELLDNALDAQATTVSVEISTNTLDIIQVKDNGCGIRPDDRKQIGKRSHTSKIETLEDLHCIGGTSLGFRGEALWSICELSRTVSVTTRTHGEVVGETFEYVGSGNLASPTKTSHPIGTSVKVHDFLHKIPVRRQTALKSPVKTLNNIKKLLQHYAIARPGVRLSVRVLKGKDQKLNWTYAPKQDATISDAAVQVVGQDVCAQCVSKNVTSEDSLTGAVKRQNDTDPPEEDVNDGDKTSIDVVLPRDDCDLSKIANGGQYISIDHRPLSSGRGLPKEILRLFKSYLQSVQRRTRNQPLPSNPFLCLRLYCPRGSYDVNVEPAKDDILLGDSTIVLELVENLFKQTYGALERDESSKPGPKKKTMPRDEDFSLFLSRKPIGERECDKRDQSKQPQEGELANSASHQKSLINGKAFEISKDQKPPVYKGPDSSLLRRPLHDSTQPTWSAPNMYGMSDGDTGEDIEASTPPNTTTKDRNDSTETLDEAELRSALVTNPWSLARLHGTIKPRQSPDAGMPVSHANDDALFIERDDNFPRARGRSPDLPTPSISPNPRQNPGPPKRAWNRNKNIEEESPTHAEFERAHDRSHIPRQHFRQTTLGDRRSPASLASNERSQQLNVGEGRFSPPKVVGDRRKPRNLEVNPDVESDTNLYQHAQAQHSAKSDHQNHSRRTSPIRGANRPFISPLKTSSSPSVSLPSMRNLHPFNTSPTSSVSPHHLDLQQASSPPMDSQATLVALSPAPSQTPQPTLASLMDYEHRKKALIASQREQNRRESLSKIDLRSNTNEGTSADHIDLNAAAIAKRFTSSPHQNRYQAAKAALHASEEPSSKPLNLLDSDPRQYLIRNKDTSNSSVNVNVNVGNTSKLKTKRLKSALLPLESTPLDARLHCVDALFPGEVSSLEAIRAQTERLKGIDSYLLTGKLGPVSEYWGDVQGDKAVLGKWEKRIRGLVERKVRGMREVDLAAVDDDGTGREFEMDLAAGIGKAVSEM
ncbi:MAG: hypothetical protein Q9160_008036 [Pyrenula sp. 1 TL-2023]